MKASNVRDQRFVSCSLQVSYCAVACCVASSAAFRSSGLVALFSCSDRSWHKQQQSFIRWTCDQHTLEVAASKSKRTLSSFLISDKVFFT